VAAKITLRQLPGRYAACRLDPSAAIPEWADGDGFVSISRTPAELSIVCRAERVPAGTTAAREWNVFQFAGPFAFDETGIALAAVRPLSEAGIGFLLIATYDTDYLAIQEKDLVAAKNALRDAGHTLA
jgi:hypothetical protein